MNRLTLLNKSVTVVDHAATGSAARKARIDAGLSLREVARRMNLSPPMISDMERGRRNWSVKRLEQFERALTR